MAPIGPTTILQRAPHLRLHLESDNSVRIVLDDRTVACGPHGLAVLNAFAHPTAMSSGLAKLAQSSTGAQDWVELAQAIVDLHDTGVLLDEETRSPALREDAAGWDGAAVHSVMLNDRERTDRYLDAISEVLRPGDVVVDVGTGTGILAMAAARAGAARVYAIESSGVGRVAKTLFAENGLDDRIVLVEGWSTQVSLPERANVMVSEIVGNDPFGEHILEVTADAVSRFLVPKARLVPRRVRLFGLPVTVPDADLSRHAFTERVLQQWRSWYGFDFGPLARISRGSLRQFLINPYQARKWEALSEPVPIVTLDLARQRGELKRARTATLERAGRLDGVLLFFELELGPTTTLSTRPDGVTRRNHWRSPVWMAAAPATVKAGDRLSLRFTYGHAGSHLEWRVR
jgi:hypothetical protein